MITSILTFLFLVLLCSCGSTIQPGNNITYHLQVKILTKKAAQKLRKDVAEHILQSKKIPVIVKRTSNIKHAYIITSLKHLILPKNKKTLTSPYFRWLRTVGIVIACLLIPVLFSLNGIKPVRKKDK